MPLPILPPPPGWELFLPPVPNPAPCLLENSVSLFALLRPLAPVLGHAQASGQENFLSGLHAEKVLGTAVLPASKFRRVPLVWIGVALRGTERLFQNLSGGCWVCGFPAIGRGRELLRLGNLADASGLHLALEELGLTAPAGSQLYFNFHYDEPESLCERAYVLDAGVGCLHGFAFPRSALAPVKLK